MKEHDVNNARLFLDQRRNLVLALNDLAMGRYLKSDHLCALLDDEDVVRVLTPLLMKKLETVEVSLQGIGIEFRDRADLVSVPVSQAVSPLMKVAKFGFAGFGTP